MIRLKAIILFIVLFVSFNLTFCQVRKFGKVSIEELENNSDSQFKDANAIVLFKTINTFYEHDIEYGMVINTIVHERIKIFNKEGYKIANKKIKFYNKNNVSEEINIKGITYNLENGKIIKTKLKNGNIYTEKVDSFWNSKSFSLPNLNDGCIVEWKYKISSPYIYYIRDFIFQYDIPIKYFEGEIRFPIELSANYEYTNNFDIDFNFDNGLKLELKNINALKKEPYVNNIENYRGKISFEITKSTFFNSIPMGFSSYKIKNFSRNWNDVTKSIYELPDFGTELKKTTYFKDDLATILVEANTRDEKINAVFNFVKSKIKWNGYNSFVTNKGVKKAYKDGNGNAAEINLILTAMLREAGFDASPILISTRSHGIPLFPTREGFNYVIAGIELQDQIILLDATEAYSTPNVLPKRVLNWQGRIIRDYGSSAFINLFPSVYNINTNKLNIKINIDGGIKGSLRSSYKNLNALTYRKEYNSLSEEELTKTLEEKYQPIEIQKIRLGNKNNLDKPLGVSLQFNADDLTEIINDKIYFSPLFFLQEKENIFKSDTRKFPIDFATPWLTNYDVIIQIPEGYKVETLPENITINTENEIGEFSYSSSIKDNKIVLKIQTKINKPIIPYNLYIQLKEFYTKRILKQNEKIVLVKE